MGRVAVICLVASGCSSVFGLDKPMRAMDAADDGAITPIDVPMGSDGRDTAFNPATDCPLTYSAIVQSSTSRYRIITTATSLKAQHEACKNDLPDATHLVALQTGVEALNIGALVSGSPVRLYIGAVQLPNQQQTDAAWFALTGEPLVVSWDSTEPNDIDEAENNEEQIAFIQPSTKKVRDEAGLDMYGAICECDGLPVVPALDALMP